MMNVVIVGAGGHGAVVKDALELSGAVVAGFVDDGGGQGVLGDVEWLLNSPQSSVIAIGDPRVRQRLHLALTAAGGELVTCIHPRAVVAPSAIVDDGAQVLAGALINPRARIGRSAIVNTGAIVEHDCIVGDWAHVSPGATFGGGVIVDEGAHVGLGAVVLPGKRVGAFAVVGAGAVVTRDVPPGAVVVGVPARDQR